MYMCKCERDLRLLFYIILLHDCVRLCVRACDMRLRGYWNIKLIDTIIRFDIVFAATRENLSSGFATRYL